MKIENIFRQALTSTCLLGFVAISCLTGTSYAMGPGPESISIQVKDRGETKPLRSEIKPLRSEIKPLRSEIKHDIYEELMRKSAAPSDTTHALAEEARKKIVFTLLYYTGVRANELRQLTYTDLNNVLQEGWLRLVLRKQRDIIVRVLPTVGHRAVKDLKGEIDLLFKEYGYKTLGESRRIPGQVMHEKAWIKYINREIERAKDSLNIDYSLSSHSFRAGFITRHLKNADSHKVAQVVGHKSVATTLRYNRYLIDHDSTRDFLDKEYPELQEQRSW